MAEIAGVTIDFTDYGPAPSIPRTMHIPVPIVDASVQDITDTLSALQADLDNLIYENLLDGPGTGGKQALGGGILVGLTTTANHLVVSFDPRKSSTSEGAVTTADALGITLIDSSATFVSDGVVNGAGVMNKTDGSRCTVLRVVSETTLITDGLGDGTDNQWDISDLYEIQNVTQCEINGGNLVAIDQIGDPSEVILPTIGTQIIRTSASSATLREDAQIEFGSFNGGVWLDPISGNSGTTFPTGTLQAPVNNVSDAVTIASVRGFNTLYILSDVSFSTENVSSYQIIGIGPSLTCSVASPAVVTGALFQNLDVSGTFDAYCEFKNCRFFGVSALDGALANDCLLFGTTTVTGTNDSIFVNCVDGEAGMVTNAVIDMTGLAASVSFRGWTGGIEFINKTDSNPVVVDIQGGDAHLASSVIAGEFTFAGIGVLSDGSTGTTTVNRTALMDLDSIQASIWDAPVSSYTTTGSFGEYVKNKLLSVGKFLGLK